VVGGAFTGKGDFVTGRGPEPLALEVLLSSPLLLFISISAHKMKEKSAREDNNKDKFMPH